MKACPMAYPRLPVDELVIVRTSSIRSLVPPAVMTIFIGFSLLFRSAFRCAYLIKLYGLTAFVSRSPGCVRGSNQKRRFAIEVVKTELNREFLFRQRYGSYAREVCYLRLHSLRVCTIANRRFRYSHAHLPTRLYVSVDGIEQTKL